MTLSPLFTREGHRERGNVCARFSDPWNDDYRLVPASSSKLLLSLSLCFSLSLFSRNETTSPSYTNFAFPLIDRRGLEDNGQGARVQRRSNSAQGNVFVRQGIRQAIRQEQSATYQNPNEAGAVEKIGQDRRYEEEGWREPGETTIETGGQSVGD